MEKLKDILAQEVEKLTQTDSKTSYPKYVNSNDEEIKNYELNMPVPNPLVCEFCSKKLYHIGLVHSFAKERISVWLNPRPCTCEQSKKHRLDLEQKANEEKQRLLEKNFRREKQQKIDMLFETSKMGERFKTRTFDKFTINSITAEAFNTAKKFVDNFEKIKTQGLGLIFTGSCGTGKTHLACSIGIDLINKGTPVIYGTTITLLSKIKQTYQDNNFIKEDELLDLYSNVDLLIIDDLGKEKTTEWVLEKLYYIINQRYEGLKSTIVTTNYNDKTLIEKLSIKSNKDTAEAIVSRLMEMCSGVSMNFEDYRRR